MNDRTCSVAGCTKPKRTRGFCNAHYERWRLLGTTGDAEIRAYGGGICAAGDCDRPSKVRGWCLKHYSRVREHGDPHRVTSRAMENNPAWQGDDIGYGAAHSRVRSAKGPASRHVCVDCGEPSEEWAYDNADPGEIRAPMDSLLGPGCLYSTDPAHYQPMCKKCHMRFDRDRRINERRSNT